MGLQDRARQAQEAKQAEAEAATKQEESMREERLLAAVSEYIARWARQLDTAARILDATYVPSTYEQVNTGPYGDPRSFSWTTPYATAPFVADDLEFRATVMECSDVHSGKPGFFRYEGSCFLGSVYLAGTMRTIYTLEDLGEALEYIAAEQRRNQPTGQ